ncbi:MAG: cob(I)yrinic acid a,c-diamide adenosyltransferase [Candidatus Aenigmarchaeota archaeon]|nr:cob(I)yrinic acid a,c-diamide adenosyltransferase [Candidatus Aenigmarchaeota archaeon]
MPLYYTGKGDNGDTSTIAGTRIPKCDLLVEANGAIDELQACIGVARSFQTSEEIDKFLKKVQEDLFIIGTNINSAGKKIPSLPDAKEEMTKNLEKAINGISERLEPLDRFVLPSGSQSVAFLHLARAVCRRAERIVVGFSKENKINENVIPYMNRLSSLLFVLARYAAKIEGVKEEKWKGTGRR